MNKLLFAGPRLGDLITYKAGCKPYEIGKGNPPQTSDTINKKPFTSFQQRENSWKPLIRGNDIKRYALNLKNQEWIKYGNWLAAPRDPRIFNGPRILIQAIRNPSLNRRIISTYVTREYIARINVYAFFLRAMSEVSFFYLLGIINSNMMNWFLKRDYGLHTYVITGILQFPMKSIDFKNRSEKRLHSEISSLVRSMLDQNENLITAKGSIKTRILNQIIKIDREIDDLVLKLYGITDKERAIIEEEADRSEK